MKKSSYIHAALLFVAFIWGTTYVIVKHAIGHIEPFTFNFLRFSLAALALLVGTIAVDLPDHARKIRRKYDANMKNSLFLW